MRGIIERGQGLVHEQQSRVGQTGHGRWRPAVFSPTRKARWVTVQQCAQPRACRRCDRNRPMRLFGRPSVHRSDCASPSCAETAAHPGIPCRRAARWPADRQTLPWSSNTRPSASTRPESGRISPRNHLQDGGFARPGVPEQRRDSGTRAKRLPPDLKSPTRDRSVTSRLIGAPQRRIRIPMNSASRTEPIASPAEIEIITATARSPVRALQQRIDRQRKSPGSRPEYSTRR